MKDNFPYFPASAALAFIGVVSFVWRARKLASWRRVQGTVVEVKKEWRSDGDGSSMMSSPVVRFATIEDGKAVTFQDSVWTMPGWHTPGQRVFVYYDPASPDSATLAGWRPYIISIGLSFAGLVSFIVGLTKS